MTRLYQEGPRDAKIVFVGESPGSTEVATGRPFVGGAGEILNRVCDRVGIKRTDCFITNICHVQPPKNEFSWFIKPKPRIELVTGLIQLKKDIEEINPNIVVALGAWPLKFLTGKDSIDKWRGSLMMGKLVPTVKVMGTYHPAFILRMMDYKVVMEIDLARALRHSTHHELTLPHRDLILDPSRETLLTLRPELATAKWLSVDIECWEGDDGTWKLACVGFSDRPDRAVTIPAVHEWQRDAIRELLTCPAKKIFQNGQFDTTVLRDEGYAVSNFEWDTMLGHHALVPECASGEDEMSVMTGKKKRAALRKGLAFQTSIYTDQPHYKEDGKLWKETNDLMMFWRYNALDAAVTHEIKQVQEKELAEFGTAHIHKEALHQQIILSKITDRGFKIDVPYRDALKKKYETELDNLQRALDKLAGGSVNAKSSKQMQYLLYDQLKLKPQTNKKTGRITADKDAINYLAGKINHPILRLVLEIRQRRDFVERYLDAKIDRDGRMRCFFDVTGTNTGRLSSRQSLYGSGTNLQNIPSRTPQGQAVRRMFVADDDMVLVQRDYSQAEARIVAHLARCDRLIELFDDPTRDIHTENASRIFGIPISQVTPEQRYLAKRVIHASNYGMGPGRLVELVAEDSHITGLRITFNQAQDLMNKYFFLYPEIQSIFWKYIQDELRYTRTLNTPFGRKRQFYSRWDDKLLRTAYAYIPQSIVGDLGRKAITSCYEELEVHQGIAQVLLNVHDSVMSQCKLTDVEHVAAEMERLMVIPFEINGRQVIIPSDCKVGLNWQECPKKEPEINPHGLKDIKLWIKEQ